MENMMYTFILMAAVYYDWKEDRIPNTLCLFGTGLGVWILLFSGQSGQFLELGIQAVIMFLLLFPLWILRVLGAGDIKLILVGVLFLKKGMGDFLCCGGVCTALLSLLYMIRRKNMGRRALVFCQYIRTCLQEKKVAAYPFVKERDKSDAGIPVSYGLLMGQICICLSRFL